MLHHEQFLSSIPQNNRPLQQSSPSDDNSMSTATPPHQISRGSPASTALVMSSNNIASSNLPSSGSSNGGSASNSTNAPNPMMRQFACHAKSMSAGIVVPVPGISNNLATTTGMNQNNMINQTIANQQQQHQMQQHQQQHQQQQQNHHQRQISNQSGHSTHNYHQRSSNGHQQQVGKQQVIREHRTHHHRSISSHQHQSHHQQQQQHHHQLIHQHQNDEQQQQQQQKDGSSQNFIDAHTGSSIVLSNNTLNNLHHRSASTQLSNIILGSVHPQPAQRTLHPDQAAAAAANYPGHVANSIWSIDENISKSRAKLTASGYLGHPYLFDPSVTDLSCDNLSQAGGPAPGYYLHHASNLLANGGVARQSSNNQHGPTSSATGQPAGHSLSASGTTLTKQAEFLPICDLMFNLLSMIIYFCEQVFGVIALIALYYHAASKHWALIGAAFMLASNLFCQYLSLRWLCKMKLEESRRKCEAQKELEDEEECERRQYYNRMESNMRQYPCGSCTWLPDGATEVQLKFLLSIALDAILHIFCLGFLVRYMKLVIPVSDTSRVKKEARDLCMLRMIHGFVQSAPLLLLQSYMVCSQNYTTSVTNLSMTSVILSLLNVCWALASFTKYARRKFLHKFVLTWLGILSQLLWRLGTISSRVAALTIYAVYYNYWMLVVLSLHWVAMFMWLVKPGNLLRDEANLSRSKRLSLAAGAAWIYCFCYLNFEEKNSKTKTGIFYLIMFFENNLLSTVCLTLSSQVIWFKTISILVVYLGFVFGIVFMMLYYKYFHVTVLNNGLSISQDSIDSIADQLSPAGKKIAGFKPGTLRLKSDNLSATLRSGSHPDIAKRTTKPPYLTSNHQLHRAPLPGVFSCKPIPNVKRQKMPSAHVRSRHNA